MNDKIIILNEKEIPKKPKKENSEYQFSKQEITKRSDFNQCHICIYEIEPLKSAYPYHYHMCNTEAFYIIEGEGKIITINGETNIKNGDIIVFPPGINGGHKIVNTSNANILKYIDFDTTNSPDIIEYPNSNKIGVIIHNVSSDFYKKDSKVDYYKGE
ncbi:MAG: cupin domain-containing protein [Bacilli bacterium]|nr:cupin domain-containing protein [Bacilli bacterium]